MNVAPKTVVTLSYTLYEANGALIEKSDVPLVYLHGGFSGIFPAVEKALDGKVVGETCRVRLEPSDAFGEYDAQLVRMEPRDKFPAKLDVGMQFEGESSRKGETLVYTVTDIAEGKVVVDGNHPLAGKALNFEFTIAAVRAATEEELSHGHVHGAHGHHH
ncbi:MAG: peptidylprolyl isomerase [Betaproteobacteria bacterium]|nr:peptidylprolyl isomerase [Betaproteobacteria bacterium]